MISSANAVRVATAAAVLTAAALLSAPLLVDDPAARGPSHAAGERFVTAWLPYWKVDAGLASFTANAELFTDLTTFFHYTTGDDAALSERSTPGDRERVQAEAASRGVPVLAAVMDDTPAGRMAAILADPAARAAHIGTLLTLVDQAGYDGIDIDYENFAFTDGRATWPQTRPVWVAFIGELAAELDARGKALTVAVPPQFNAANDETSGYWVYDWPSIAPYVDSLRVMTYDYSINEPGPISPLPWVQATASFGIDTLGADRFRIGAPTYGRDWVLSTAGAGCASTQLSASVSRTAAELLQIAAASGVPVQFDETNGEAFFHYTQALPDCSVSRVAHVSDAPSVAAKADLALSDGAGIALWSLGGEDPATWDALRQEAGR